MTSSKRHSKFAVSGIARVLGAVVLTTSLTPAAFAQEAVKSEPEATPGLGDIVVTARQRSESLQETPLSIAAITSDRLDAMGVQSVLDLDSTVPSLSFSSDSTRLQPFIGIRGVGDYSRNPGFDNRAGIYLDGVLVGRSMTTDVPVFDIERVEVLRGPQGTLFGKDSLTGVISITSVKPKQTESWRATVRAGSRNLLEGSAYFNLPLNDTMAMRLSLSGQSQDGYYTNLYNDQKLGSNLVFAGRFQYRWTPSADTTIDLAADYVRSKQDPVWNGAALTGPGATGLELYQVNFNRQTTKERTLYGSSLNIEQRLPGDFVLTSITAYRVARSAQLNNDLDISPLDQATGNVWDRDRNFSQEIRIASPDNKHFNYVVGAFYYWQHPSLHNRVMTGVDFAVPALRQATINVNTDVAQHVAAVFAHGTFKPLDWLAIDGGIRYSHTSKKIFYSSVPGIMAAAGYANVPEYRDKLSEGNVNPLVSLTVTPVKDINLYALFSTGSRAGGYNADLTLQNNFTFGGLKFGSESVKNYEVGIKSTLFDRRLRLNISAYHMDFNDFQVSQQGQGTTVIGGVTTFVRFNSISNAAKAVSEGVEIDFDAAVTRGLRISGGAGFNHAYFKSFPNAFVANLGPPVVFGNYDGNSLIEAPRFNGSVTADYTTDVGGGWAANASVSVTYKSQTFSDPSNAQVYRQAPYTLTNGRIGVLNEDKGLQVYVFARNLLNERYVAAASTSGLGYAFQALAEPRTIGIELQLRH